MYIFEAKKNLNIDGYKIKINNFEIFDIIEEFKIPFNIKYQIYVAFENKFIESKDKEKMKKNVSIISKCLEYLNYNEKEYLKFKKTREEKEKGYLNYLNIMTYNKSYNYCYKPNQNNNNGIISFIKEAENYLKNIERQAISEFCITKDKNALYATGIYKDIFLKSHFKVKNEKEERLKNAYFAIWNNYINEEIRFPKAHKELNELFGSSFY